MAGPRGAPRFEPSRSHFSGSMSITGSVTISGSLIVTGSVFITGTVGPAYTIDGLITETTGNMRVFVHGDYGDDALDGLTFATSKRTFQSALDVLPDFIRHNCVIHLTGTIADTSAMRIKKYIDAGVTLLIDGGPNYTIIDDNGGAWYSPTATSTGSMTVAAGTWTLDTNARYFIQMGPLGVADTFEGMDRNVARNTDSAICPTNGWTTPPVVGVNKFRFVKPNTSFASNNLNIYLLGPGVLRLQRFEWTANNISVYGSPSPYSFIGSVVCAGVYCLPTLEFGWTWQDTKIFLTSSFIDSSSFSFSNLSKYGIGNSYYTYVGGASPVGSYGTWNLARSSLYSIASNISGIVFNEGHSLTIAGGRVDRLQMYESRNMRGAYNYSDTTSIVSIATSNFHETMIGSGSCDRNKPGLILKNSSLRIGDKVWFPRCTTHAIECENSILHLSGNISGSCNGFAIYAHDNSIVQLTPNTTTNLPSILTGSLGFISVDGTSQICDFQTVNQGTDYSDLTDGTIIKKHSA